MRRVRFCGDKRLCKPKVHFVGIGSSSANFIEPARQVCVRFGDALRRWGSIAALFFVRFGFGFMNYGYLTE